jgi:hypothetical protein
VRVRLDLGLHGAGAPGEARARLGVMGTVRMQPGWRQSAKSLPSLSTGLRKAAYVCRTVRPGAMHMICFAAPPPCGSIVLSSSAGGSASANMSHSDWKASGRAGDAPVAASRAERSPGGASATAIVLRGLREW